MFNTHTKNILNRMMGLSLLSILAFVVLCFTGPSAALGYASPLPVDLYSAGNFVFLAETGITNTGSHGSVITGNIGNSPGTAAQMDGVWCSEITGTIYGVDAAYTGSGTTTCFAGNPGVPAVVPPDANKTLVDNAVLDMMTAYVDAAGRAPDDTELGGGNISGMTLAPGVYKWSTGLLINTNVTLSGSASDVWIFEIAGDLSIASGGSVPAGVKVILSGGAQASNIFWQVGGATGATLGTYSTFNGTILSAKQVILQTGAVLNGRGLAQTQVVLDANVVTAQPPPGGPTLEKAFSPIAILEGCGVGDESTLTITLSNSGSTAATLTADFTDILPIGVEVANLANAVTTCTGGVFTPAPLSGDTEVTLSAGSIPASSSCTVTVDVCAMSAGNYINILPVGALVTSNGSNAVLAIATLTVNEAIGAGGRVPTVSKSFTPATINAGGTSLLTITLSNTSLDTTINITTLDDYLPFGVVVAPVPAEGTTCAGGVFTPVPLSGNIAVNLTGGIIPLAVGLIPGTCTVTVNVTAATAGSYINIIEPGDLVTDQGNNADQAIATLTVPQPPVAPSLTKAFNPDTIVPGRGGKISISTLTITLINPNSTTATLQADLTDNLPGGVLISNPPNAVTTCGGGTTVIASANGTSVTLPLGSTIPASGSCTVTVDVRTTAICAAGSYPNTIDAGDLQTDLGNNVNPATATLTVAYPVAPTLSKDFSPATIGAGGVSTLTITLNNPNSMIATLIKPFTDKLPKGVKIANPANASTDCTGSGIIIGIIGGSKVTLPAWHSIPANSSCTVTVDVTASKSGIYINKLKNGALRTDKGRNDSPATATLTVL